MIYRVEAVPPAQDRARMPPTATRDVWTQRTKGEATTRWPAPKICFQWPIRLVSVVCSGAEQMNDEFKPPCHRHSTKSVLAPGFGVVAILTVRDNSMVPQSDLDWLTWPADELLRISGVVAGWFFGKDAISFTIVFQRDRQYSTSTCQSTGPRVLLSFTII